MSNTALENNEQAPGKGKLIGHIIDDFKNGKEIFVPAQLTKIKDDLAIERGYPDWYCMQQEMYGYEVAAAMSIVCQLYATESVKEYKEKLKAAVKKAIDDHYSIGSMDVLNEEEINRLIDSYDKIRRTEFERVPSR
jgi:hypothetical protein